MDRRLQPNQPKKMISLSNFLEWRRRLNELDEPLQLKVGFIDTLIFPV